jgi:hypothetical protein
MNPLVGSWEGFYLSPIGGSLGDEGFTLTVQGGGEGVGTGRYWYSYFGDTIMEILFIEIEVAPDGSVSGSGTWMCEILDVVVLMGEGEVTGNLDAETLTGSGKLQLVDPEGTVDIPWEVIKAGS